MSPHSPDEVWEHQHLQDVLEPRLEIVFVGFNPGKWSATRGHHFAGPNNHFWRLLAEAGITPRLLQYSDDRTLPQYGLGVTNIVARPSHGSNDLSIQELGVGGDELVGKLGRFRPKVVCLLGKDVYRAYAGLRRNEPVEWGKQSVSRINGIVDFVAPNPSSRSTIPFAVRLEIMKELQSIREQNRNEVDRM